MEVDELERGSEGGGGLTVGREESKGEREIERLENFMLDNMVACVGRLAVLKSLLIGLCNIVNGGQMIDVVDLQVRHAAHRESRFFLLNQMLPIAATVASMHHSLSETNVTIISIPVSILSSCDLDVFRFAEEQMRTPPPSSSAAIIEVDEVADVFEAMQPYVRVSQQILGCI